jgi:hypothetical protein
VVSDFGGPCACLLYGLQDAVSQLLAAGANPNTCDNLAGCPLLAAVRKGHLGVVSRLVAAGAKLQLPAAEIASALCNAVACGDKGLVQCFMEAGADASAVDHCGQTPLHVAAAHDKLEMVSALSEGSWCALCFAFCVSCLVCAQLARTHRCMWLLHLTSSRW